MQLKLKENKQPALDSIHKISQLTSSEWLYSNNRGAQEVYTEQQLHNYYTLNLHRNNSQY